jgi:phage shock protein PspC (stress-responsive transcriptional regulator)
MSRDSWNIDYGPMRGLYRDRENGWVFGVCAGLADRFNFRVATVRVIAIISLLLFFWLTAALYLGATVLIKEKPLVFSGSNSENDFWYRCKRSNWRHS